MTNEMSARLALHTSTFPTAWWNCRGMLNNTTDPRIPAHASPFSPFGYPSEILITKCDDLVIAPFQMTGTIGDMVPAIHRRIDAEVPHYGQFRQIVRPVRPFKMRTCRCSPAGSSDPVAPRGLDTVPNIQEHFGQGDERLRVFPKKARQRLYALGRGP